MEPKEFEDMICEFVQENYEITGCRSCHETGNSEITPVDLKGSWGTAVKELFEKLIVNRIKVKSSNIDFVSYSEEKQELSVWFKSRNAEEHYVYSNVSVTTFGELMDTESKGGYFAKNIKGNQFKTS